VVFRVFLLIFQGLKLLELITLTKRFPGVVALDSVSLRFNPGEIHALLGENGAGKSTVMHIIAGNLKQDEGKIVVAGNEIKLNSYHDAIENKISIVNQEIQIVPESSVAENIMLDKLKQYVRFGRLDWKKMNEDAGKYLKMVGLDISPKTLIIELSAAHKQLCQIAKALSADAKYLLLDEPTSSLTEHEVEHLFTLLKNLRGQGVTIIFVSHKIEEVLKICDKISVLRDGKYVGTRDREGLTKAEIVKMMIGRETEDVYLGELDKMEDKKVLEVKNLKNEDRFDGINFYLKKGEILGFYGLVGSGRTELAKVLIGEDKKTSGEVLIN
jgi:ribose transport system ATP-binding protein